MTRNSAAVLGRSAPILLLAYVLTACSIASTNPSATSSPSGSPTNPSPTDPSPTPSSSGDGTALPYLVRLATVKVNDLNLRSAPSTSADRLLDGDVPVQLDAGARVLVIGGPVDADGYQWFAVAREEDPTFYAMPLTVAWVAGGTLTDPWIEMEDTVPCPTEPTIADLAAMTGILRLICYGTSALTFDAHQAAHPGEGLGGVCQPEPPIPDWLICDNVNYNWVNTDGDTDWLFLLHFDPAVGIAPTGLAPPGTTGPPLRITGHFGDKAAQDCVTSNDPASIDALGQWLTCAARFVVEGIQPLP